MKERLTEEQIAVVEQKYDLPVLEGTEKQVAWARAIRAERLSTAETEAEKMRVPFHNFFVPEVAKKAFAAVLAASRRHTEASFWINHRYEEKFNDFARLAFAEVTIAFADAKKEKINMQRVNKALKHIKETEAPKGAYVLRMVKHNMLDREWKVVKEEDLTKEEAKGLLDQADFDYSKITYACLYASGKPEYILIKKGLIYDVDELEHEA